MRAGGHACEGQTSALEVKVKSPARFARLNARNSHFPRLSDTFWNACRQPALPLDAAVPIPRGGGGSLYRLQCSDRLSRQILQLLVAGQFAITVADQGRNIAGAPQAERGGNLSQA
jgi:hypothetical protein